MLVKVWTELSNGRKTSLLAKIISESGNSFTIRFLSPTEDRDHGCVIYRYEDQTYDIDDDSITEYLGTSDESDVGFRKIEDGFVRYDSDSDYVPSSEEDEDDDEDDGAESYSEDFQDDEEEYIDED